MRRILLMCLVLLCALPSASTTLFYDSNIEVTVGTGAGKSLDQAILDGDLGGGGGITLPTCTAGQIWYDAAGDGIPVCIDMPTGGGGSSLALDLGNDGDDSTDLIRIVTSAISPIFTETPADTLFIDLSQPWPTATSLATNPSLCAAGFAAQGIDATGAAAGCFDVATQGELDALVLTDLADVTGKQGNGTDVLMHAGGSSVQGNAICYDANGNANDCGQPPGGGGGGSLPTCTAGQIWYDAAGDAIPLCVPNLTITQDDGTAVIDTPAPATTGGSLAIKEAIATGPEQFTLKIDDTAGIAASVTCTLDPTTGKLPPGCIAENSLLASADLAAPFDAYTFDDIQAAIDSTSLGTVRLACETYNDSGTVKTLTVYDRLIGCGHGQQKTNAALKGTTLAADHTGITRRQAVVRIRDRGAHLEGFKVTVANANQFSVGIFSDGLNADRSADACPAETGGVAGEICQARLEVNQFWECQTATCDGAGWVNIGQRGLNNVSIEEVAIAGSNADGTPPMGGLNSDCLIDDAGIVRKCQGIGLLVTGTLKSDFQTMQISGFARGLQIEASSALIGHPSNDNWFRSLNIRNSNDAIYVCGPSDDTPGHTWEPESASLGEGFYDDNGLCFVDPDGTEPLVVRNGGKHNVFLGGIAEGNNRGIVLAGEEGFQSFHGFYMENGGTLIEDADEPCTQITVFSGGLRMYGGNLTGCASTSGSRYVRMPDITYTPDPFNDPVEFFGTRRNQTEMTFYELNDPDIAFQDHEQLVGGVDACRNERVRGGGYDPITDRFAWTCGNFDWTGDSLWTRCTGDAAPDPACLYDGERLKIKGVVTDAMMAVDYTVDGGNVYLPEGIYVSRGCDTSTCAQSRESPGTDIRKLHAWRGISFVGESSDVTGPLEAGRTGTYLVNDHGWGTSHTDPDYRGQDPSGAYIGNWVFTIGGQASGSRCVPVSDTDGTCSTDGSVGGLSNFGPPVTILPYSDLGIAGNGSAYDVSGTALINSPEVGGNMFHWYVCIPKDNIATRGVCQKDPRRVCSTETPGPPSAGGCQITGGPDYGPCMEAVDWIEYATEVEGRTDLELLITQTNRQVDEVDEIGGGWQAYLSGRIAGVWGDTDSAGCQGGTGREVMVGPGPRANGWPFGVERLYGTAGLDSFSQATLVSRQRNARLGGYRNVTFMPAHWYQRLAADDQVPGCTTDTSGVASLLNLENCLLTPTAHVGYTVVIDEQEVFGPAVIRTIQSNTANQIQMDVDHEAGTPTLPPGSKTVRISHASCMSGSDYIGDNHPDFQDDERVCDTGHIVAYRHSVGGSIRDSVIWGGSSTEAANIDGSGTHIGGQFVDNVVMDQFRGGAADLSLALWSGNLWKNINSWGYMGIQSFTDNVVISDETIHGWSGNNVYQFHVGGRNISMSNIAMNDVRVYDAAISVEFVENLNIDGITFSALSGKGIKVAPNANGIRNVTARDMQCHMGCAPEGTSFSDWGRCGAVSGDRAHCAKSFALIGNGLNPANNFLENLLFSGIDVVPGGFTSSLGHRDGTAVWIDDQLPDAALSNIALEHIRFRTWNGSGKAVVREASNDPAGWSTSSGGFSDSLFETNSVPLMTNISTNGTPDTDWSHRCINVGTDAANTTCDAAHEGQIVCVSDDTAVGACSNTAGVLDGGGASRSVCACRGAAWSQF